MRNIFPGTMNAREMERDGSEVWLQIDYTVSWHTTFPVQVSSTPLSLAQHFLPYKQSRKPSITIGDLICQATLTMFVRTSPTLVTIGSSSLRFFMAWLKVTWISSISSRFGKSKSRFCLDRSPASDIGTWKRCFKTFKTRTCVLSVWNSSGRSEAHQWSLLCFKVMSDVWSCEESGGVWVNVRWLCRMCVLVCVISSTWDVYDCRMWYDEIV